MKTLRGSRKVLGVAVAAALLGLAAVGCGHGPAGKAPDGAPSSERSGSLPGPSPPASPPAECPIQLHDVSAETGIAFQHTDGSGGRHYIVETVASGLATFDYDGDGLIDVYFPNGTPLAGTKADKTPRHALYKNLGGWKFRDVSEEAGVACTGYGLGAAAGDYDNDGHPDLYVSNFGPKVLYRNRGDGTFADETQRAGVADGDRLGAGVCFLDVDADGLLDLFVANYVKFSYPTHVVLHRQGFPEYVGPRAYPPDRQTLYRNRGDGTFADATESSGIARHLGKGMGVVCADYDRDGNTDVFLLNDVFENFCFRNDGAGHFQEVALENGLKYNGEGSPLGSMGVDCADYDRDGWLDFFQTSYQGEWPVLFRNLGNGYFEDATVRTGAGQGSLNNVKWGCGFVDFDNDGHLDLFIAMGHLQDEIDHYDASTSYHARNVLLRNTGQGRFVDVSAQCGDGLKPVFSSRGAAFDDLDNDGDVDVIILNSRERPTILQNMLQEQGSTNHWLQVRLRGVKTNRDGVGAQVKVVTQSGTQLDEVHSGRSYQSHFGSRLHFGLGSQARVERIEVRWIGGGTDVIEDVPVDRLLVITEGTGRGGRSPGQGDVDPPAGASQHP